LLRVRSVPPPAFWRAGAVDFLAVVCVGGRLRCLLGVATPRARPRGNRPLTMAPLCRLQFGRRKAVSVRDSRATDHGETTEVLNPASRPWPNPPRRSQVHPADDDRGGARQHATSQRSAQIQSRKRNSSVAKLLSGMVASSSAANHSAAVTSTPSGRLVPLTTAARYTVATYATSSPFL
jgi:hypothetical protein